MLLDARRLRGEIVAKAGLAKGRLERVRRSKSKYALSAATGDEAAKGGLAQANVTLRKVELDLEDLEEASEQAAGRVQLAERELARLNDLARADRIEILAADLAGAAGAVDGQLQRLAEAFERLDEAFLRLVAEHPPLTPYIELRLRGPAAATTAGRAAGLERRLQFGPWFGQPRVPLSAAYPINEVEALVRQLRGQGPAGQEAA